MEDGAGLAQRVVESKKRDMVLSKEFIGFVGG
jgi:hypothetical protein